MPTKFLNSNYPNNGDLIGIYIAIFIIALPVISTVLDFIGVADKFMHALGDKAHSNYIRYYAKKRQDKNGDIEKGYKKFFNCCGQQKKENFNETELQRSPIVVPATIFGLDKVIFGYKYESRQYDKKFLQSLLKNRTYYNCYSIADKNSKREPKYFDDYPIYWDGIFYLFNTHSVLSTICTLPEHPISRQKRMLAFIVRHGFGFLVSVLLSKYSVLAVILLNILFITPLTGKKFEGPQERVWSVVKIIQTLCIILCILVSAFWFILAGILTAWYSSCTGKSKCGQENLVMLTTYMYQVFIVGFGLEFVYILLRFASNKFYFGIKVLEMPIFEISRWFAEYVEAEDIVCTVNTYSFYDIIKVIILTDPIPKQKKSIDMEAIIPPQFPNSLSEKHLKALFVTSKIMSKMKNDTHENSEEASLTENHLKAFLVAATLYENLKQKKQITHKSEPINEKAMEIAKQIKAMIVIKKWIGYVLQRRREKSKQDSEKETAPTENEVSVVETESMASETDNLNSEKAVKKKKNRKRN